MRPPCQSKRKPAGEAEVGANLEFVLDVFAGVVGAIVAIGIALQEGGGDETVGSSR